MGEMEVGWLSGWTLGWLGGWPGCCHRKGASTHEKGRFETKSALQLAATKDK